MGDDAADGTLEAGPFSAWLRVAAAAVRGDAASDVPCGGCTACCESAQFVHVGPHDTAARRRIPSELLFPAPGLAPGHLLLGYDEQGRCPMLGDAGCTIYADRPRTCRTYDCRVFAAAGMPADDDQPVIAARAARWRFEHPEARDRAEHDAVRAAASFLEERPEVLGGRSPRRTELAVAAIEAHRAFLGRSAGPSAEEVRVELRARRPPPSA